MHNSDCGASSFRATWHICKSHCIELNGRNLSDSLVLSTANDLTFTDITFTFPSPHHLDFVCFCRAGQKMNKNAETTINAETISFLFPLL